MKKQFLACLVLCVSAQASWAAEAQCNVEVIESTSNRTIEQKDPQTIKLDGNNGEIKLREGLTSKVFVQVVDNKELVIYLENGSRDFSASGDKDSAVRLLVRRAPLSLELTLVRADISCNLKE